MPKLIWGWCKRLICVLIVATNLCSVAYADELSMDYEEVAKDVHYVCSTYYPDVDEQLVLAICWHESGFQPGAANPNSDCVGLMQVSTYWNAERADRLGVIDFFDPVSNIMIGVDVLNFFLEKHEDVVLAIMLYGMNHNEAYELYDKGVLPEFAQEILELYDEFKKEEGAVWQSRKQWTLSEEKIN